MLEKIEKLIANFSQECNFDNVKITFLKENREKLYSKKIENVSEVLLENIKLKSSQNYSEEKKFFAKFESYILDNFVLFSSDIEFAFDENSFEVCFTYVN